MSDTFEHHSLGTLVLGEVVQRERTECAAAARWNNGMTVLTDLAFYAVPAYPHLWVLECVECGQRWSETRGRRFV